MSDNDQIPQPGTVEWEQLCQRCGRCCYEKIDYDGRIFYTDQPCPHLDLGSMQCRIYDQRAQLHPECVQLTHELIDAGILPADCPYVRGRDDYNAPLIEDD